MHGALSIGRWTEITAYFTCVKSDGAGRWITAACRHCKWVQSANITRMKRHWHDMHQPVAGSQPRSDTMSSTSSITPTQSDSSAGPLSIFAPSSANSDYSDSDSQGSQATGQSRKRQRSVLEWTDATFAPDSQD